MIRLDTKLPSFREHRLFDRLPVREGFIATNCSVATHEGRLFGIVNCIDHYLDARGHFVPIDPDHNPRKAAVNLNYLVAFDDDLSIGSVDEIPNAEPVDVPWEFRGFECPRLISWKGALHVVACSHSAEQPAAKIFMGHIQDYALCGIRELTAPRSTGIEKNWMPEVIGDKLRFHYRLGTLVTPDGATRSFGSAHYGHFHGGTQVVPYELGGLCIVHTYRDIPGTHRKNARQHFVRTFPDGQPFMCSPAIEFGGGRLEIACGMAYHPDGKRMIVGYGRVNADDMKPHQEHAFIAEFQTKDLRRVL